MKNGDQEEEETNVRITSQPHKKHILIKERFNLTHIQKTLSN